LTLNPTPQALNPGPWTLHLNPILGLTPLTRDPWTLTTQDGAAVVLTRLAAAGLTYTGAVEVAGGYDAWQGGGVCFRVEGLGLGFRLEDSGFMI